MARPGEHTPGRWGRRVFPVASVQSTERSPSLTDSFLSPSVSFSLLSRNRASFKFYQGSKHRKASASRSARFCFARISGAPTQTPTNRRVHCCLFHLSFDSIALNEASVCSKTRHPDTGQAFHDFVLLGLRNRRLQTRRERTRKSSANGR